jgi:PAS domain S-box-containing protein
MDKSLPNISFQLLYTAVDQSPVSVVVTDRNGSIEYVNAAFCKLSGYTFEEALGNNPRMLKTDFHDDAYYQTMWDELSKGNSWSGLFKNRKKSGEMYWEHTHIHPVKDMDDQITHYLSIKRDVTEEIENRNKAEQRERLLNDIQVLSLTGGWELDVPTNHMYWTDQLYQLHGVPVDYNGNLLELVQSCIHPDDRDTIITSFRNCLATGIDYDHTVRFINRLGVQKWVRTKSRALTDESGAVAKIIGSVRDVTDEIEALQSVQESETRFKAVVNAFDDIVFTLDRDGVHTELFGQLAGNEILSSTLLGKTSLQIMGEVNGKIHHEAYLKALNGEHVAYNWSAAEPNGQVNHYQTKLTPLIIDDQISGILGVGRNITQEVMSRLELKVISDRLKYALDGTQAGSWDWNIQTGVTIFNERWATIVGYTLEELNPTTIQTLERLTHPEDLLHAKDKLSSHFEGIDDFYDVRFRMLHKDGRWIWVWDRGRVVERDDQGNPVRMVGTHVDVTELIEAEERVQRSEKRYRDLFKESSDASLLFKNDRIVDCNQAAVDMLGYDTIEELVRLHPLEMVPEYQPDGSLTADRYLENVTNAYNNRSYRFELYHLRKDGMIIPLEVTTTLLQDEDGSDLIYIIWRDVTARKKAESALLESIKEKETLLSEIHHRVKNNLAVISALMQLQLYSHDDPMAVEILSKSINRIKSIALIHEQLYKSDRFSNISLKENIERQTETVLDMYGDKLGTRVNLLLDLKDVSIDINQAMPVGLLLNEILNNAFKHAFHGRDTGTIGVTLDEHDDQIYLTIQDDGVGFNAEELETESTSLGNTLIKTFLEQLQATYTINTDHGTRYDIRFDKILKE